MKKATLPTAVALVLAGLLLVLLRDAHPERDAVATPDAAESAPTDRDGGDRAQRVAAVPDTETTDPPAAADPVGPPPPPSHASAIAAMARHSGLSAEEIEARLTERAPWWFDTELVPLEPWDAVASEATGYVSGSAFGDSPGESTSLFESAVLGMSLEEFEERHIDESTSLGRVDELESILADAREPFDRYEAEGRASVMHKVGEDRIDRWPYLTIEESRRHTVRTTDIQLMVTGGLGKGWVIQFNLYEGEYPTFDLAKQDWMDAKSRAQAAVKDWIQAGY